MGKQFTIKHMDAQKLQQTFQGNVIVRGDDDYDTARQLFYGGVDKKPAIIIQVANVHDVRQAILLAREHGLDVAVRSGGHSAAGHSSTEGGLVIDMRRMRSIDVDPAGKTVRAEAGVTAGELTAELDKHNLVLGFGDTGSVGIGGITLGGGVGYLARKFGLAIDNLLGAEVVTATGEILQVDSHTHPDLFWALKGGGGNFGVVTKFTYRLHELGECYGGVLFLPATPAVIAGFVEAARNAPDELSTIVNIMPVFPMPGIPAAFHGKLALMVLMVYADSPAEGEKAVAPIRALAKPIADMVKPMRYKDIFVPEDLSRHPTAVSRNMYLKDVDETVAATIINQLNTVNAPLKAVQLRVLGGAVARVEPTATAYAHRHSAIMCNIACFYENSDEKQAKQSWVNHLAASLYQGDDAAYVNFLGPDEQDRLSDAYPPRTLAKLKQVKAVYDPDNFFKLNVNISPDSSNSGAATSPH